MNSIKVAAYITAFEDKDALVRCVKSIANQTFEVQEIIVIDNSFNQLIDVSDYSDLNIYIIHFPENIGISGGLDVGVNLALEKGYDFLWTFDQDSEPETVALERLIYQYEILSSQGNKIGMIGPLPVDTVTGQKWHGITFDRYRFKESLEAELSKDYYHCDAIITSGSLVNLHAARQVPLPRKDLFIDAVDWDYCMNFRSHRYEIILAKNITLKHRFGNTEEVSNVVIRRKISIHHYSALRYYYICRNHTFIETRLSVTMKNTFLSALVRTKSSVILLIKILFYEKEGKWLKIWACLLGTFDGFRGKLGKNWV